MVCVKLTRTVVKVYLVMMPCYFAGDDADELINERERTKEKYE